MNRKTFDQTSKELTRRSRGCIVSQPANAALPLNPGAWESKQPRDDPALTIPSEITTRRKAILREIISKELLTKA